MALPSSKPPPANPNEPKPRVNRILVDEKGQVFLNDAAILDAKLKEALRALKTDDPDPKIVVKGADNVDYQSMIKVLDALQQLEITKIDLATLGDHSRNYQCVKINKIQGVAGPWPGGIWEAPWEQGILRNNINVTCIGGAISVIDQMWINGKMTLPERILAAPHDSYFFGGLTNLDRL